MKYLVLGGFVLLLFVRAAAAQTERTTNPAQPQGQLGWVQVPIDQMTGATFLSFPTKDTAFCMAAISSSVLTTALKSTDGGETWQAFSTPPLWAMSFIDGKNGYTAGYTSQTAYHTSDGGQNWTSADDSDQLVSLVCAVTRDTCFLAGNIFISRTTDAGKTWKERALNVAGIQGIAFHDSKHGIVVGEVQPGPLPLHQELTAGCYTTSDGGESWVQQYTGAGDALLGVTYCSRDTLVAIGGFNYVSRSVDGGHTWDSIPNQFLDRTHGLLAVASSGSHLLAVGSPGLILASDDAGLSWRKEESGITTDLNSVQMLNDSVALAVGDAGIILKTTNGGTDWVQVSPPSSQQISIGIYPEPETPTMDIFYDLPQLQDVTITVYDMLGKIVAHLLENKLQTAGRHSVQIKGVSLPAGSYIVRIQTERFSGTGKFEIVK